MQEWENQLVKVFCYHCYYFYLKSYCILLLLFQRFLVFVIVFFYSCHFVLIVEDGFQIYYSNIHIKADPSMDHIRLQKMRLINFEIL